MKGSAIDAFWEKVDTGPADECWIWQGAVRSDGYGSLTIDGGSKSAHRVGYFLGHGTSPDGDLVLHKCDTKRCVNPCHLYSGDKSDNLHDAYDRGQREPMPGESNGNAKLTNEEVAEIRSRLGGEQTHAELAAEYGVSRSTVSMISSGENWGGVK